MSLDEHWCRSSKIGSWMEELNGPEGMWQMGGFPGMRRLGCGGIAVYGLDNLLGILGVWIWGIGMGFFPPPPLFGLFGRIFSSLCCEHL